jgi:hypothetical protein|tara:strand:+ start:1279 stop:1470 length:192 start_codon:yes stop_codon:yes gene_type:complete
MDKVYKVQKKIVVYVETEITASSKAEAKRFLDLNFFQDFEDYGEFYDGDGSYDATYKVLYEIK